MTGSDTTGPSSDKPPLSFFEKLKKIRYVSKRIARHYSTPLFVVLVLLNASVAHLFAHQVSLTASAQVPPEVKDEVVNAVPATNIPDQQSQDQSSAGSMHPVITTYKVVSGDTLSGIAEKFGVSINTIRWANDLTKKSLIKVGDELVILPFSGIEYTVKSGDTLSGITAKYGGDEKEIIDINGLDNEKDIKPGDKLLIPDGEIPAPTAPAPVKKETPPAPSSTSTTQKSTSEETSTPPPSSEGYYAMPIPGSTLTQGLHAINAVDLGAHVGTHVLAAASGTVLIARQGGYNGGFGNYIVINHPNGTQTLYAHLSKVLVTPGQTVTQGQEVALSGSTGKSTGPHLHFEVHGATNPWAKYRVGTHF